MVSLAILATAFTAALKLHSDSITILLSSRSQTKSAELAQYKMTEFEIKPLGESGRQSGDFGELAPDYLWEVRVEDSPEKLWKIVTVHVRNKHGGRSGEFELVGYTMDKGALARSREEK